MGKELFLDGERENEFIYLNYMLNGAIASSRIKSIQYETKNGLARIPRTQIHFIIFGKPGISKSYILNEIADALDTLPAVALSRAILVGSFEKQSRSFTTPLIWDRRNSALLVDEFHFDSHRPGHSDIIDALLQLMENGNFSKKIHGDIPDFFEKNDDLFLEIKNKELRCNTRFSLIATTMHSPLHYDSVQMQAFFTRCVVFNLMPTMEEIFQIVEERKKFFAFKDIKVKKNHIVKKADVDYILEYLKKKNVIPSLFLRVFGDCVRYFCVFGRHNDEIYKRVAESKDFFAWREKE